MKHYLKIYLPLLIAVVIHGQAAMAYDFMVDGIAYNIKADGTAEVTYTRNDNTGYDNYAGVERVIIPNTIKYDGQTYTVTSIGNEAFIETNIRSVTIPNSVQSIGENAFYESWLLKREDIYSQIMNPMEIPYNAFFCSYDYDYQFPPEDIENWPDYWVDYYPSGNMLYRTAILYVPLGTMELYKQTPGWNNFEKIREYDFPVEGIVGDVTGDGGVDIGDVNAVINMMLGKSEQTAASDVTGDGSVDIADVNAVINIMLGKSQSF